ncbi:MAG: spermidine/putrescine ABC transporter permease PotC [Desulfomicrobium sp.]|nr:spermidine/putrescine ABC transporter permease PotC [Pseudomonadota bacterium]MBV1710552.1 spermidine/putrescine ABC transporter permease PotC [Desulfomicrobium sp.]MBU4570160.1 spermidine/putrescine ABC transporter permease PotC [Pseudomonadota bacterium]MBU4593080.1 spermidine/putrescine ABC transporter permease PotC [Pseudomonadota bacterium]MBV1718889.1 spermidine/putrescine ABC transporter permease PotC [Desulfomicrobium sp.]
MRKLRILYATLVFVFLYLPLGVMVVYSFNASRFSMAWKGFTLDWYVKLFSNAALMQAALNSLLIAALAATCSSILGTLIAMALQRWRFPSRKVIHTSLFVMMMSPDIVIGISLLVLFMALSLPLGFWTLLMAHVTLCVPFVSITVYGRLLGFDPHVVEAARDLGAGEYEVFRHVVLPMVFPAVLAGWFLSFTLSIDDVIISFFTTGPTFEVLPLRIYSMVRLGLKPEVNALCAIMILITAVAVFVSQRFLKEKS